MFCLPYCEIQLCTKLEEHSHALVGEGIFFNQTLVRKIQMVKQKFSKNNP